MNIGTHIYICIYMHIYVYVFIYLRFVSNELQLPYLDTYDRNIRVYYIVYVYEYLSAKVRYIAVIPSYSRCKKCQYLTHLYIYIYMYLYIS